MDENMMIDIFILTLFLTFIVIRFLAYTFHDMKNYGTKKEKSFTLTGYLRKKTGYDFHHLHLGIILSIITITLILILKLNILLTITLAISTSMILDQIVPFVCLKLGKKSNYFSMKNLIISLILHIIVAITSLNFIHYQYITHQLILLTNLILINHA